MDGNGRWAKLRHKRRVEGHRAGIASVRDVVETSARLGPRRSSPSTPSRSRTGSGRKTEVSTLMALLKRYLRMELRDAAAQQHPLPGHRAHGRAAAGRAGRAAARRWSDTAAQHAACSSTSRSTTAAAPRSPTPCGAWWRTRCATGRDPCAHRRGTTSSSYLYTAGQPDPDLLIRTSGEMRISQLPALADRLRRDLGDRRALARLPPPAPAAGDRRTTRSASGATAGSHRPA